MAQHCYQVMLDHIDEVKTLSVSQFSKKYHLNREVVLHFVKYYFDPYAKYINKNGNKIKSQTFEIISLICQSNMTYQEIADAKGVSRQRVGAIAKSYDISRISKRCAYYQLYQIFIQCPNLENMTASEIADKFNVSYHTTLRVLNTFQVPFKKWHQKKITEEQFQNLLIDLKSGNFSYKSLGEKYNLSTSWVIQIARKHHLTVTEVKKAKTEEK